MILLSSANDFAPDVVTVKQRLSAQARGLRKDADGLRQVIRRLETRKAELERGLALAPASTGLQGDLAHLTGEIEILSQKVKELDEQAAALQARFDNPAIDETLDENLPSLLVAMNGGLVKITQLSNAHATGSVLLPLNSSADADPGSWQVVDLRHPRLQPPRERPRSRLARRAQGKGTGAEHLQLGVLHLR